VDADIDAFFDNLDHGLLMQKVAHYIKEDKLCALIEKWVRAEVYDGKSLRLLDKGIPQGSVISPILANLFLDEALLKQKHKLVRYSDDFIILCKSE
jgi:retron-type reverse transcriptase